MMRREEATVNRICLTALIGILGCSGLTGQSISLTLASGNASRGATVSLPLSLTASSTSPAGLQWSFDYSPSDIIAVNTVASGAAVAAAKTINCASPRSGHYICLLYGLNGNTISNGVVATASFTLSSSTLSASSNIQVTGSASSSLAGDAIPTTGSGGTITILSNPDLASLVCSPVSFQSPGSSLCTVTLSGPSPQGGTSISLTYASPQVTVTIPPAIAVPADQTAASFSAQIGAAAGASAVALSASLNGASRTVTLQVLPAGIGIAIVPTSAALTGAQQTQFSAMVTGTNNTLVIWAISPAAGMITSSGLYTAPAAVAAQQTITVKATSAEDSSKVATATVTLVSRLVISSVGVTGVWRSATVAWLTNAAADSQIMYGTSPAALISSVSDGTASTNHLLIVNGVTAGVLYHYRLISKTESGLWSVWPSLDSAPATFELAGRPRFPRPPPVHARLGSQD